MTIPKLPPHRFGFTGDPSPDGPREFARWVYLHRLAELHDAVLIELWALHEDEAALPAWAERWRLTDPWCLAYAHATMQYWREHPGCAQNTWSDYDEAGGQAWEVPPESRDERDLHALALRLSPPVPRPLKDPAHLDWLIRFQRGEKYADIAKDVGRDTAKIHEACRVLSTYLGLTLRPTRQGRPRKAR